jgi:hypothetical protein
VSSRCSLRNSVSTTSATLCITQFLRASCHCRLIGCRNRNHFRKTRLVHIVLIGRNSNRSQNADDRHDDHQFDKGKTFLSLSFHVQILDNGRESFGQWAPMTGDPYELIEVEHSPCQLPQCPWPRALPPLRGFQSDSGAKLLTFFVMMAY